MAMAMIIVHVPMQGVAEGGTCSGVLRRVRHGPWSTEALGTRRQTANGQWKPCRRLVSLHARRWDVCVCVCVCVCARAGGWGRLADCSNTAVHSSSSTAWGCVCVCMCLCAGGWWQLTDRSNKAFVQVHLRRGDECVCMCVCVCGRLVASD